MTIGGQTPEGADATNELTYLILESRRISPMPYPDLATRIHARSPERFLWEIAETVKVGQGYPKLFNDEEIIPLHVAKGAGPALRLRLYGLRLRGNPHAQSGHHDQRGLSGEPGARLWK